MKVMYPCVLVLALGCAKEPTQQATPTSEQKSTPANVATDASACTMVVAVTGMS